MTLLRVVRTPGPSVRSELSVTHQCYRNFRPISENQR